MLIGDATTRCFLWGNESFPPFGSTEGGGGKGPFCLSYPLLNDGCLFFPLHAPLAQDVVCRDHSTWGCLKADQSPASLRILFLKGISHSSFSSLMWGEAFNLLGV